MKKKKYWLKALYLGNEYTVEVSRALFRVMEKNPKLIAHYIGLKIQEGLLQSVTVSEQKKEEIC